jgi:hypothetical protein
MAHGHSRNYTTLTDATLHQCEGKEEGARIGPQRPRVRDDSSCQHGLVIILFPPTSENTPVFPEYLGPLWRTLFTLMKVRRVNEGVKPLVGKEKHHEFRLFGPDESGDSATSTRSRRRKTWRRALAYRPIRPEKCDMLATVKAD